MGFEAFVPLVLATVCSHQAFRRGIAELSRSFDHAQICTRVAWDIVQDDTAS
jgi:hypothetical protein